MKQGPRHRPHASIAHSGSPDSQQKNPRAEAEGSHPKGSDCGGGEGIRLNKALAGAGVCSRRQADALIAEGLVKVNGVVVRELGLRVDPASDSIEVEGRPVPPARKTERNTHLYVMLHKPVRVVSTVHDPEGRTTVLDLLPDPLRKQRLYPVGRLDFFSEGLLLLTDDGDLTHRLTHPKWHLPKRYRILVREDVTPHMLRTMRDGMTLAEGDVLAPVDVDVVDQYPRSVELEMILHQGVNRQIRRMCRDVGLTVLRLRRVQQGPIFLGDLAEGVCRLLTENEVRELRTAAGLA